MTEQIVNFERMEYALTLFGNSDENIRMLEQGYGVSVVFRGTDIKVRRRKGDDLHPVHRRAAEDGGIR